MLLAVLLVGGCGGKKQVIPPDKLWAEANEALIKLARLHGVQKRGEEGRCYKIICAKNAFHGRTYGGMSATPQEKIQKGFRPLVPGFAFGEINQLQSFADLVDDQDRRMREHLESTLKATGGLGFFERRDEVRERAVVHPAPALRSGDGEADREVRLAHTGRPEEDHILPALDEAEVMQALDLLTPQRGLEGEVEIMQLLDRGQAAGAHRRL